MSKLEHWENEDRKAWKADAKHEGWNVVFYRRNGVTLVFKNFGKTTQVTWSLAAPEDRAKRKRGEYEALVRWANGYTLPVPSDTFDAEMIAESVSFGERDEKGKMARHW